MSSVVDIAKVAYVYNKKFNISDMTHQGSKSFNVYHTSESARSATLYTYAALIAREGRGNGEF